MFTLKKSLVAKMLVMIFLPTLIVFSGSAVAITLLIIDKVEQTMQNSIVAQSKLIAAQFTANAEQEGSLDWITDSEYGEENSYLLLDGNNNVLSSTNDAYTGRPAAELFSEGTFDELAANTNNASVHIIDSEASMCVISPVGDTGFKVMTAVPINIINEESGSMQNLLIMIFGALLLVVLAAVLLCTLFIVRPINKLKDATLQIADGNFFVTVDVRSKDEVGQLARAIQKTVQRLSNYVLYIDEITEVLTSISEGDLTYSLRNEYIGEFASIKEALLGISDSFNKTMSNINNAAEQVSGGSIQVSGASQALSQGSTQQASSVEELSATIKEVNDQVKLNAENAKTANNLSVQTVENVENCSELMRNMLDSMEQINGTSSNIAKIIKVIDDISFQTNILALNAAVEAARAGAAGKGFAVVADEVRNLATKSAQAAKNTTELIESSIKAVESGVGIAQKTATALDQIVQDSNNSSKLIGDITLATNEQATAVMQITQGVEQISTVVETNSATAQQTAAASEELSSQADLLKKMTSRFKLKNSSALDNEDDEDYDTDNDGASSDDDQNYAFTTN
ncbi:MAG: methyl-accepting chemotaxis protein [Acetanaerobacterium sp.]